MLYSKKYNFAGTIDRIGTVGKTLTIVDIKTGAASRSTAIQLAGYEILAQEEVPGKYDKMIVMLKTDVTYAIMGKEVFDPSDKSFFLSCLNIYNYKKRGR